MGSFDRFKKSGDDEIDELRKALRHKDPKVRFRAVKALEKINWSPKNSEDQYHFNKAKKIDELPFDNKKDTVKPKHSDKQHHIKIDVLMNALRHKNLNDRFRAVKALDEINWKPKKTKDEAYYLNTKRRMKELGVTTDEIDISNWKPEKCNWKPKKTEYLSKEEIEAKRFENRWNKIKKKINKKYGRDIYKIDNKRVNKKRKKEEKRLSIYNNKKSFVSINDVNSFSGFEFEFYLKLLFQKMGYSVQNTNLSGDQGADLIIKKFNSKIAVQAKRYQSKVSNRAVQEVVASVAHYGADRAMVITNSEFTKSAIELAHSNNVELIDGYKLKRYMKDYPIETKHI